LKQGTEKPSLPDPVEEKTREKGEEKQPKTKINTLLTLLVANSREKAEQEQVIYKPKDCSNS